MFFLNRTVSIGALSLLCLLPISAAAISPDDVSVDDPVSQPPDPEPPTPDPEPPTPDPEPPTPDPDPEPPRPEPPVIIDDRDRSTDDESEKTGDRTKTPRTTTKTTVPVYVPPSKLNTYPVPTRSNYCPAGLQPVTISGTISCGKPNRSVTYQQMMKHPQKKRVKKVQKKRRVIQRRSAVPTCYPGTKGCTDR